MSDFGAAGAFEAIHGLHCRIGQEDGKPNGTHFGLVAPSAEIMLFGRPFATFCRVDSCRRFESSEIVKVFFFSLSPPISVSISVSVSLSLSR